MKTALYTIKLKPACLLSARCAIHSVRRHASYASLRLNWSYMWYIVGPGTMIPCVGPPTVTQLFTTRNGFCDGLTLILPRFRLKNTSD